ncbi:aldehyde dehydrogenase [Schleiferia thermophila]|uniref:Aminomuconate-semialdehyde/2-hydroxymuconate-6-semialdehyde dehydrogenase n=1 Tax=Schleiferia thermophila TaxID=884107 RepID=A0A368ZVY8_9FLAO|nr:aldehyde dehydrogenase [Schleiferia thermophila]RCX01115.1 aminomuconate-semialdehyde/2-hydroxymuconate-6-semialdehyde dehydrogenase [Schleiferia thermophila]GCD80245.1 2-hydroxymuconic semialdehyde dehydrogenase [Schleiferia thermophila]
MEKILNYIDGKLIEPVGAQYIENIEPATGKVYSLTPDSDHRDIEMAYEAASKSFRKWAELPAAERSRILLRISELIEQNLETLALAESKDNGKPLKLARMVDIPRARDNFSFFATAILHTSTDTYDMGLSGFNYTLRQPVGVAGCISPWNLPLYLFSWKVAPALAAGCTVVGKPSEITPYTAYLLGQLCIKAGLPPGVFNIVHGYGHKVGQAITEHPGIRAISFTGGTSTGKRIAQSAAPHLKKLSLELGGKNSTIVLEDCDYQKALSTAVRASFSNQGQICLCGSKILVQRGIYDRFKKDFVAKVSELKVGDPYSETTQMGALVSENHLEKVLSYIDLAQEEGGKVLTGGQRIQLPAPFDGGYYLEPTVIEGLPATCRTNREEIFGPVVTLLPFDTAEEAIAMANATEYGLACSIFTSDLNSAHLMARQIEAGVVWVNTWLLRDLRTPFGGMKSSGIGREGGRYALEFFTEPKNICVAY